MICFILGRAFHLDQGKNILFVIRGPFHLNIYSLAFVDFLKTVLHKEGLKTGSVLIGNEKIAWVFQVGT
jgi:hypothetical protein